MFRRVRVFEVACVVIGLVALCSAAQGDVIGPGNYSGAGVDTANEMITDWSHPLSLAAGTYNATTFSYDVADGWGQGAITVQPFLATGTAGTFDTVAWSGTVGSYTPILVGNAISFSANYSAAPFADYAFPGSGSFTLDAPTTVYAGFWASGGETPYAPPEYGANQSGSASPIKFAGTGGGADAWTIWGADPTSPVVAVGQPLSGGGWVAQYPTPRAYDFSITVTLVPEPGTLSLLAAGLIGLLAYAWRKRK